jgi:hypothetical protein
MQSAQGVITTTALWALGLTGCAHTLTAVDAAAERADRIQVIARLVLEGAPDALASAALLAPVAGETNAESLDLIARAVALAPERADLVWEQRMLCERSKCESAAAIEARLKTIDPENGYAWLADLQRAQNGGSAADITKAIGRIGASARISVYWNRLEVMLFDALGGSDPAPRRNRLDRDVADRAIYAIGILAALSMPMRPPGSACRAQDLEDPGRRTACAALVARMEQADTVLIQSYALSIQERWWAAGTAQRELLRAKRRKLDYEIAMSSKVHLRINRDMAIRMQAARRFAREEDVNIAVLRAYHIAPDPPPGWRDTLHQEFVPPAPVG